MYYIFKRDGMIKAPKVRVAFTRLGHSNDKIENVYTAKTEEFDGEFLFIETSKELGDIEFLALKRKVNNLIENKFVEKNSKEVKMLKEAFEHKKGTKFRLHFNRPTYT